jgi:hypothetical protein
MGWDVDEANFGNICVQERPGSSDLLRFNAEACRASEFLADIVVDSLGFGTLSYSHLHQCLKNIAGGCTALSPTSFMLNGRLSVDAVASVSPALAESVTKGLQWTVLSWKIRDVTGAMELIQAAWNRKAGVAMKESSVQAVSRLAAICNSIADADLHVDFNMARDRLHLTMPEVALSSDFTALLRFCVTLGSNRAPWIDDIKQFVGLRGQNRQVKAAVFALAGQLPNTIPHIIKGLVVMAYTAPPAFFFDNFSRYLTGTDTRLLVEKRGNNPTPFASERAVKGEAILRDFHSACGSLPALVSVPRLDFLCAVDSMVCRFLTNKHFGKRHDICPSLEHVAESFHMELEVLLAGVKKIVPDRVWKRVNMLSPLQEVDASIKVGKRFDCHAAEADPI